MSLSILYLGADSPGSTSRHRADALRRLGNQVYSINPYPILRSASKLGPAFHYRTGYRFLQHRLLLYLQRLLSSVRFKFHLIWVDSGELLGCNVVDWLSNAYNCKCVLYNVDDVTGPRDYSRFQSLREALSLYALCVFVRPETSIEALAIGARKVLTVHRSYDEVNHSVCAYPAHENEAQPSISFVGTFIPGERRDLFLAKLISSGLPIRIYGNRWLRSNHKRLLRRSYKGASLSGKSYAFEIGTPTVTLGFLSHGNRDLITQRTLETPACGGLLCAERTSEHQLLYEDGHEAVFWDSPEECIQQCLELLHEPTKNHAIRSSGNRHVRRLGVGNEDICRQILASI